MRLPVPTGQETEFIEAETHQETVQFFIKYKDLFTADILQSKNARNLEIDTVEKFELLRQLLSEKRIPKPKDNLRFIQGIENFGLMKILPKDIDQAVENIYNGLKELIDKHNLYFDQLNDYDLSRVINNVTVYSLYQSIIDPIDLLQSMESVDGPTDPIKYIANTKSVSAEKAKVRNPGNWMNKIESILENQEGKDCIAISAVGIKGFFALTQYFNEVLNSGDPKKQEYLINTSKKLLANIRAINPDTIINQDVVDTLIEQGFQEDQAVVLSALLGLSADNAKELALAKLNAGSKTIGIYLYAISTGTDFENISDLMMSPTGLIVRSILDDDIFQDINGYFKLVDSFGYFEYGPTKHLSKYNKHLDSKGNVIKSPLDVLNKELNQYVDKNNKKTPLLAYFDYCRANGISLSEQFEYLDHLQLNYKGSEYGKTLYLQLLDFAKSYLLQLNDINWQAFRHIKYLAKGADEMRILGAIAGLNQGIPTDLKGILNKCELIENIFDNDDYSDNFKQKVVKTLGSIYIDLNKFAFNPIYRQECIDLYNEVKHTFNILDAVSTLDHLLGYIQTLATDKSKLTRSYKFRGIVNNYKDIMKDYKCTKDEVISGIEKYIGNKLLSDFLHSVEIELPKGTKVYGQDTPLQVNTTIRLGDEKANTTFRIWMENEVIPNLKKGIGNPRVSNNKFIKDLSGASRNNTISGNSSIIYTIPINMLPRTENERSIFNQYLDSFNELDLEQYNPENLFKPVSIMDLFILYSMIAHDWTLSENSLVPILENQMDRGIIKQFHFYETFLDKSDRNVEQEIYFKENVIPYIASHKGPYGSMSEYVWGINPDTESRELMTKVSKEELRFEIERAQNENVSLKQLGIINGYKFIGITLDPNYFTRGDIKTESEVFSHKIKHNGKMYTVQVYWTRGSGNDSVLILEKDSEDFKEINEQLSELKTLPTKVINGIEQLDMQLINGIIKQKLNCK